MSMAQAPSFDSLTQRISEGNRRAVARTILLSLAAVALAALFLFSIMRDLDRANDQLKSARMDAAAAVAARDKAEADGKAATSALAPAQDELKTAKDALAAAQDALKTETEKADALGQQVTTLQSQLIATAKAATGPVPDAAAKKPKPLTHAASVKTP